MVLATCIIMGPAVARWPFDFMQSALAIFIVLDSFVVFMIAYDLWTRRSLHRATLVGAILSRRMAACLSAPGPLGHARSDHRMGAAGLNQRIQSESRMTLAPQARLFW
jgi:hypothetical protein